MNEPKVYTMEDILNYEPTEEELLQAEREEFHFRKGYYYAICDVIVALGRGLLPRQLGQFADGALYSWYLKQPCTKRIEPPEFPEVWFYVAKRILKRDNYICHYCGEKANSVDHIVPVSRGGTDDEDNLVSCCRSCNSRKGTKDYPGHMCYRTYKASITEGIEFAPKGRLTQINKGLRKLRALEAE